MRNKKLEKNKMNSAERRSPPPRFFIFPSVAPSARPSSARKREELPPKRRQAEAELSMSNLSCLVIY